MPPMKPPASDCCATNASAPGKPVNEGLHRVRRPFLAQEVEDNANRLFCVASFDADVGDETADQLIHDYLTPPALVAELRPY